MDKVLEKFFEQAKKIELSSEEREHTRVAIQAAQQSSHLSLHTDEKATIRVELLRAMRKVTHKEPWFAGFQLKNFVFRPALALAIFFVFVVSGKGLLYSIDHAQPGGYLYPFKINVTEVLMTQFIDTPEAQAAWAVEQLERRLNEFSNTEMTDEEEAEYAALMRRYAKDANDRMASASAAAEDELRAKLDLSLEVAERKLMREAENRPSRRMLEAVREARKDNKRPRKDPPKPTIQEQPTGAETAQP